MPKRQKKRSDSPLDFIRTRIGTCRKKYDDYMRAAFGEGIIREIVSFVFALVIAFLFLKALGVVLNTESPLVVIESESMVHRQGWEQWHIENGLGGYLPDYPFSGGMGIGDVALVIGGDSKSVKIGDVIIYINPLYPNPIIHRVVGIAKMGNSVETAGIVKHADGKLEYPCGNMGQRSEDLKKIMKFYKGATYGGKLLSPGSYNLYFTKGDNNALPDQCIGIVPVHSDLVVGTARFDLPLVGYVKLGFVCVLDYLAGNACPSRCWWTADNPRCKE